MVYRCRVEPRAAPVWTRAEELALTLPHAPVQIATSSRGITVEATFAHPGRVIRVALELLFENKQEEESFINSCQ